MKVEIEKIDDKLMQVDEDIPAKSWSMDSDDVKFLDNIHIDCGFVNIHGEIVASANVTLHRQITCSRCLERAEQTISHEFKRVYNVKNLGQYLEIDNDIREEILLNFPMKVLCRPDCRGLCSKCGVNANFQSCNCNSTH